MSVSADDRAARRQAVVQIAQLATNASATQRSLTGLRTVLNAEIESWKKTGTPKPSEAIQKATEDLMKKVEETCRKFANPSQCGDRAAGLGAAGPPLIYTPPTITQRLTQLLTAVDNYSGPPTAWQLEQIKLLGGMLRESAAAARKLTQDELAALNKMMNEAGVAHIVIPPPTPRATGQPPG